jgi:hypothetical protein
MIQRSLRDESGMTMGLTVIMILLIGVMGAGLLAFVQRDLQSVIEVNRGQKALDIAEAGVQAAKAHLRIDSFRQHYDTNRANDCQAVFETFNDEDGNPVVHEPGGPRVGGDNWSKATDIWTDPDGFCIGTSTRSAAAVGVNKNFAGGKFHVTIECYDQFNDLGPECVGGAGAAPESNVPASDRKFFKITSTGYDNTAGDGAIRKVEAIYYTSKKGHLPMSYFTPGNINFAGVGTITVKKLSLFAGGNITGTQSGSGTPIADRCTPALYRNWNVSPYNTAPRIATSDPCPAQPDPPEGANAIVGAGFGAVGLVCGTAQCSTPADSVADGRNDYDSTTNTQDNGNPPAPDPPLEGQGTKFVYKEDAAGNPAPKRALTGTEISFPFDPGTSLEPGQTHTIIGLDLQEEMARAADAQGSYFCFNSPGCPTATTHTINTADWPTTSEVERVVYFVDGADVVFKVNSNQFPGNTGNNNPVARGILVVRGGDLQMNNASNGFEGLIIVIGNGSDTGNYDQGGNVQLDGYAAASGTVTIHGSINPSSSVDYTNLSTFYDVKLWSWRELYQ